MKPIILENTLVHMLNSCLTKEIIAVTERETDQSDHYFSATQQRFGIHIGSILLYLLQFTCCDM